jgi:hypothetical protein
MNIRWFTSHFSSVNKHRVSATAASLTTINRPWQQHEECQSDVFHYVWLWLPVPIR